jgi:hypothetical protein
VGQPVDSEHYDAALNEVETHYGKRFFHHLYLVMRLWRCLIARLFK